MFSKLDFTLDKYRELCLLTLKMGYAIMTVRDFLQNPPPTREILVMRHDVDRLMAKALRMADLENSLGITSTYYFRKSGFSRPEIIKKISNLGHEIGYHYETLDEARGNYDLALIIFKQRLEQLRQIAEVKTICMHGNPLTRWLNSELWDRYDFHVMGIIGEAFLSFKNVFYLSDTGRIWDMSRKVKDMLPSVSPDQVACAGEITTTNDVISLIKSRKFPRIYITVHPERWSHNLISWTADQTRDTGMNIVKQVYKTLASGLVPSSE